MNGKAQLLCFLIYVEIFCAGGVLSAKKRKASAENSDDYELFPIYECDERSREWTKRCLVPLTNAQLSLDLCGTGEKVDQSFVKRCAKELQVLAQSCPQQGSVSQMANDMLIHKPPPLKPAPASAYESPNTPKVPKTKRTAPTRKKKSKKEL